MLRPVASKRMFFTIATLFDSLQLCFRKKRSSVSFIHHGPYVKNGQQTDGSKRLVTTLNHNLILILSLFTLMTGCTVVQDYGEDYLDWRDIETDSQTSPVPDSSSDSSEPEDSIVPTDIEPTDISDAPETDVSIEDANNGIDVADTTEEDTNPGPPMWDKSALFDVRAYIRIIEFHDKDQNNKWKTAANEIRARFDAFVPPAELALKQESGGCKLYLPSNQDGCVPACSDGSVCTAEGTCEAKPPTLNVGAVEIKGLSGASNGSVVLSYGEGGEYTIEGNPIQGANLFAQGDAVIVQIEGSAELGPYDIEATGVSDMQHNGSQEIALSDFEDYVFSWDATGKDEIVELTLKTGPWISNQAPQGVLICAAHDSAGAITIPKDLIGLFPYFDGQGNDQHPSFVRRLSRTVVDTDAGPIDLSIISESYLRTVH